MEQDVEVMTKTVEELLRGEALEEAVELVSSIHPADQAELFWHLEPELRQSFLALLSAEGLAHLLEYLEDEQRAEVVEKMPRASLARVLDRMNNDVAADILHDLPPSERARVLSTMSTATEVTPLLEHAEESAGGIMTRGFVALHAEMAAQDAITYLRLRQPNVEEAYYLYVMDAVNRLEGVVSLRQLVVAPPHTPIREIMSRDVISVGPETDQEECARLIQRYRLRALPVVDEDRRLLGITTMDDAMAVISEEATEDMYRIVGLPAQESVFDPVTVSARRRLPWLFLNILTALAAAGMVNAFKGTIAQVAAVAVFMPMVAGLGGNAGIQTITLVVREIALGEIELRDARRVLIKEVTMGLLKGIIFGVVVGLVAWAWQVNWTLGLVVGLAMLLNMLVAGFSGAVIPLGLRWLRLDPALASGILLTAVTDVLGFFFLLGLATLFVV
ncbi:MAG: magnesium transporter [Chloroflexota bacterium]|nr:magnesium transporter [Chloroflexota bacterium]